MQQVLAAMEVTAAAQAAGRVGVHGAVSLEPLLHSPGQLEQGIRSKVVLLLAQLYSGIRCFTSHRLRGALGRDACFCRTRLRMGHGAHLRRERARQLLMAMLTASLLTRLRRCLRTSHTWRSGLVKSISRLLRDCQMLQSRAEWPVLSAVGQNVSWQRSSVGTQAAGSTW